MSPRSRKTPEAVRAVEAAFDAACGEAAELATGRRLLLACSAGGDSMTLLDLAARRGRRRRWELAVVHVDHGQRGESAAEARFVADQARRRDLECFVTTLDEELLAASPLSEDVMRQARLTIFKRAAARWHADAVALAHQADDRAETFLIRLLAGSGPTGLASIRPMERMGGLVLVRPLLAARREQMRAYLRARELPWRDDPTNADLGTKRGWVRHRLLPLIRERIGLDPTGRIVRAAELIEGESRAMHEAAGLILGRIADRPGEPILERLDLADPLWREAGEALRRQVVRHWLWRLRGRALPPGYAALAEAMAFIAARRRGAELRTVERIHVVHTGKALLAFAPATAPDERRRAAAPYLPPPRSPKRPRK